MPDDPTTGGTVRYHRAEYDPDRGYPWMVWFTDSVVYNFTAAEGEAMGLTPPEPAPLVVTCNGHSVELSDEEVALFQTWGSLNDYSSLASACARRLARLLRDARQDPQPADFTPAAHDPSVFDGHVRTAGQPEQDDTASDTIDFDALPIGTVLRDKWGDLLLRREGGWFEGDDDCFLNADDGPFTVVYRPAPLSPGECLRGLLAGRTDADELIEYAARHWVSNKPEIAHPQYVLTGVIGDAAREVHGG